MIISIKSLFDNCPSLSSYDYAPESTEKVKPMNQIQKRAKIVKLADKLCFQKGYSSETQFSIRPVRQWVGQKHQDTKFHRFRGLEKSLISQSRIISAPGSFRVFFFLKQYGPSDPCQSKVKSTAIWNAPRISQISGDP